MLCAPIIHATAKIFAVCIQELANNVWVLFCEREIMWIKIEISYVHEDS